MGTAVAALDVARHWLGYRESGNNDNVFGRWYGFNNVSWCAIFVSFCTYTSGTPVPATTSKGFSYCFSGEDWAKAHGRWHTTPQVGDLCVQHGYHNEGHIGIVEQVHSPTSVTCIEGNEENQVERRERGPSDWIGFIRPAYSAAPAKPTPTPTPKPVPVPAPSHPRWPGRQLLLASPLVRGADVVTVQHRLNVTMKLSPKLTEDGVYGQHTKNTVVNFQTAHHLKPDGVVGPITWDALWTAGN